MNTTATEQAEEIIKNILEIDNSSFWNYVLEEALNKIKVCESMMKSKIAGDREYAFSRIISFLDFLRLLEKGLKIDKNNIV